MSVCVWGGGGGERGQDSGGMECERLLKGSHVKSIYLIIPHEAIQVTTKG